MGLEFEVESEQLAQFIKGTNEPFPPPECSSKAILKKQLYFDNLMFKFIRSIFITRRSETDEFHRLTKGSSILCGSVSHG